MSEILRIADGLWRWTAPHPEWTPDKDRPGGWGRMVGCVYYEPLATPGAPIVLIDPLAPPAGSADADRFWTALETDLKRARRPVAIAIGNSYHVRDESLFRARVVGRSETPLSAAGVEAMPLDSLGAGETAFFIREHRALVFSDAVVGTGEGRLAVVPLSWAAKGDEAAERYRRSFRADLKRLLDLDPEIVLPSHGEPVLAEGREALAAAVDGPAWGE